MTDKTKTKQDQDNSMAHAIFLVEGSFSDRNNVEESFMWDVCWRTTKGEAEQLAKIYNDEFKIFRTWYDKRQLGYEEPIVKNRLNAMSDPKLCSKLKEDIDANVTYKAVTLTDDPELNNYNQIVDDEDYEEDYVKFGSRVLCDVCMAPPDTECHAIGSNRVVYVHDARISEGRVFVEESKKKKAKK